MVECVYFCLPVGRH